MTVATSASPGKQPMTERQLSAIFNSSEYAEMSKNGSNSNSTRSRLYSSGSSDGCSLAKLLASKDSMYGGGVDDDDAMVMIMPPLMPLKSQDINRNGWTRSESTGSAGSLTRGDLAKLLASKDVDSMFGSKDPFRSMDSLSGLMGVSDKSSKSSKSASVAATKKALADLYTSRDWMPLYQPEHQDIAYNTNMFGSDSLGGDDDKSIPYLKTAEDETSKASPAPQAGDWMETYMNIVAKSLKPQSSLVTAFSEKYTRTRSTTRQTPASNPSKTTEAAPVVAPKKSNKSSGRRKRRSTRRKVIPDVKEYVIPDDLSVLLGRGGRSNKHPGNARYRDLIEEFKARYRACSKQDKTGVAQELVDYVESYGGRFLELDKEKNQWYVVPNIVSRRKCGQALREDNTAENRREKRVKYKKNRK